MGSGTLITALSARAATAIICAPVPLTATISHFKGEPARFPLQFGERPAAGCRYHLTASACRSQPYDGRWKFTGAGCRGANSVMAIIKNGQVFVRGGNVTSDGIIHTVGAGNGLTLTAEGRLSGDSSSGTYDRSDGCSGTWISVKQPR